VDDLPKSGIELVRFLRQLVTLTDWPYKEVIDCFTYTRIYRWLFLSITIFVLVFILIVFMVGKIVNNK